MILSTGEIAGDEARARAEQIKGPDSKRIMLRIAEGHDRQAALLEKKLRDSQNSR